MTRQELLSIKEAVLHFHPYLYGTRFVVRTGHGSLRWLMNFKEIDGQLCRWSQVLATYNYTIVHRSGKLHGNADSLSRRPCGTCRYCERVEKKHLSTNEKEEDSCQHVIKSRKQLVS